MAMKARESNPTPPQSAASSVPERRQKPRRQQDHRLLRRQEELEAALRISQSLFQHISLDKLIRQALLTALEVVDAEGGSVLLAKPETKELIFQESVGKTPVPRGTAVPWEKGIVGAVFTSGTPAVITEASEDTRHFPLVDKLTGYKTKDMIVLPLKRWEGEPIGVLTVVNKCQGVLNQDDVAILQILSAFTAVAIDAARLFEQAKVAELVRLLGDIGHDIKNMLTPIVMGAEILEDDFKDVFQDNSEKFGAAQKRCENVFAILHRAIPRLHDRVKELADCVKGATSPPVFAPCSLKEIIDSVYEALRLLADDKNISLITKGLDTLPTIIGDQSRLFNAFYNLVNNAIPEVQEGGSVTISAVLDADAVAIDVADTGRGMPADIRDSLFSARVISRKAGGTGLGTKIVKDAVDVHGGTIGVESREGVGTTFHIHLPLRPPGA
jgi:signal transduction histidine kinase